MSDPRFDLLRKKRLIPLLREAAEIEQQVMVQYLYAAYSLKKFPDATCTPAEFEHVRRWGTILLSSRARPSWCGRSERLLPP